MLPALKKLPADGCHEHRADDDDADERDAHDEARVEAPTAPAPGRGGGGRAHRSSSSSSSLARRVVPTPTGRRAGASRRRHRHRRRGARGIRDRLADGGDAAGCLVAGLAHPQQAGCGGEDRGLVALRGQLGGGMPVVHDDDAVGHADDLGELRRDHEDGDALLGEPAHELVDGDLGADVDAAGGLVEQHHAGLRGEPLGEHDLLLVAAREVLHLLVDALRGDLQRGEDPRQLPTHLAGAAGEHRADDEQRVVARPTG